MAGLVNIDLGSAITSVGNVLDDLFTSDEERMMAQLEDKKLDVADRGAQIAVNLAEAQHKSVFVAGWRPFIGWVGGLSLAWQFIGYPITSWYWVMLQSMGLLPIDIPPPPPIDAAALYPVIFGMLGIGGMRSYDKKNKVVTNAIAPAVALAVASAKKKKWQFWKK